jgi:hypothetical protein
VNPCAIQKKPRQQRNRQIFQKQDKSNTRAAKHPQEHIGYISEANRDHNTHDKDKKSYPTKRKYQKTITQRLTIFYTPTGSLMQDFYPYFLPQIKTNHADKILHGYRQHIAPAIGIGVMTPRKTQLYYHAPTQPRHPAQEPGATISIYHSIY